MVAITKNKWLSLLAALVFAALLSFSGAGFSSAHAADSEAMQSLSSQVYSDVSSNDYKVDGGGKIKGSELMEKDDTGTYVLNKDTFEQLSPSGRNEFSADVFNGSTSVVKNGEAEGLTTDTQRNWLYDLMNTPGFGSQVMMTALNDIKPDFITARAFWAPWMWVFNAIIGIFVMGAVMLMVVQSAIDFAYVLIPMFQGIMGQGRIGEGDNFFKRVASSLVSQDARYAVEKAEGRRMKAVGILLVSTVGTYLIAGFFVVLVSTGKIWVILSLIFDLTLRVLNLA